MKKLLSLIVLCLMISSFGQIVYGSFGETQIVQDTWNMPRGWMIESKYSYGYVIVNLNDAPYNAIADVYSLDNMPANWVQVSKENYGYRIRCLIHDYTPPTVPANLRYSTTLTSVTLSWLASTDLIGVTGYNIYKDNKKIASITGTSYTVNGLTPNTGYNFAITAKDYENESAPNVVSVNTDCDNEPPTSPKNLICTEKYDTSLKLSWSASTDNLGVAGYNIYMNGVQIGSTKYLTYTVSNLQPSSTNVFSIQAYDVVGNTSTNGNPSLTLSTNNYQNVVPYIAGCYFDANQDKDYPCYWKGSTRIELGGWGCWGGTSSIYVSGDTVYTAGFRDTGSKDIACYWQGNTRVDLPMKAANSSVGSMCVSGGIVYTAGYDCNPGYWIGDKRVDLDDTDAIINSIYVSNGTVYIAGRYNDGSKYIPCYWKGNTRVALKTRDDLGGSGIHDAYANDIYVSDNTVYTAGSYWRGDGKRTACYWIGSTRVDLPEDDAVINSIYVSDGIVYTVGQYYKGIDSFPCYWVGSTRVDLSTQCGYANSIYVKDGSVYTVGYYNDGSKDIPCYWRGNTRFDFVGDGTQDSRASAIFIP